MILYKLTHQTSIKFSHRLQNIYLDHLLFILFVLHPPVNHFIIGEYIGNRGNCSTIKSQIFY